jgi:hypothetical protein
MGRNHCIDVIAREIITSPISEDPGDKRDVYPDIGEDDWEAVVNRAYQILDDLAPDPRASRSAYRALAERNRALSIGDGYPLVPTLNDAEDVRKFYPSTVALPETSRDRLSALFTRTGCAIVTQDRDSTRLNLLIVANLAMRWLLDVDDNMETIDDVHNAVRAEYDRAHHKHDGLTPLSPDLSDDFKAAILLEEVGEVARACTPDAHTDVGHAGDLTDELVQVATMACAWAQCILNKEGE